MQITLLLFAGAKDMAGSDSVVVEVPEPARARDVLSAVSTQIPALAALVPSCRLAVDCCYVDSDHAVSQDAEVALIPPVSGG